MPGNPYSQELDAAGGNGGRYVLPVDVYLMQITEVDFTPSKKTGAQMVCFHFTPRVPQPEGEVKPLRVYCTGQWMRDKMGRIKKALLNAPEVEYQCDPALSSDADWEAYVRYTFLYGLVDAETKIVQEPGYNDPSKIYDKPEIAKFFPATEDRQQVAARLTRDMRLRSPGVIQRDNRAVRPVYDAPQRQPAPPPPQRPGAPPATAQGRPSAPTAQGRPQPPAPGQRPASPAAPGGKFAPPPSREPGEDDADWEVDEPRVVPDAPVQQPYSPEDDDIPF